jgi:hypothetical protein
MYGKDMVMAQAYPCSMDPYLLTVRDEGVPSISSRLLGIAAEGYCYLLYQQLRPKLGLPEWERLVYAPETLPEVSFAERSSGARSWRATILSFDGGELELYRPWESAIFTFYSFDLDYRAGMKLLAGFEREWMDWLIFWFARDQPRLEMTIEGYLKQVAALPASQ